MDRALAVRALGLYGPVTLALGLALGRRIARQTGAAVLLGVLWMLPGLLALQLLNQCMGWWSFATRGPALLGMPVELYLGWCCLWGAIPVLGLRRLPVGWAVVVMVLLDLVMMPLCAPVVVLGRGWLTGEAVAAVGVLLPGVLLTRWTTEGRRVRSRAAMQGLIAAGIFLFLLPEVIFAVTGRPLGFALHGWQLSLALQLIAVLALPGLSAVQEFAGRGGGTPIPYDPPPRLVTSGMYRYLANPMQMGCAAVLLAWSIALGSGWLAGAAAMAWCYGAGIARWDESSDLRQRFGLDWVRYRKQVHDWRVRWRPYTAGEPARLYVATACGPCSELGRWLSARQPAGLLLVAAEEYPGEPLRRMRYVPSDGGQAENGLRALARGLEHLHFGWALAGAVIRLPGIREGLQTILDCVGFGEREPGRMVSLPQLDQTTSAADDADQSQHALSRAT